MHAVRDWESIRTALVDNDVCDVDAAAPQAVGGGDISAAWRLESKPGPVFLKTGPAESLDMFSAEAAGLDELRSAKVMRIPAVLACGSTAENAFLALEWLQLEPLNAAAEGLLGQQLAALHRHTADRYGWHRDNTIGRTPQQNRQQDDWLPFFGQQRLEYQFRLAATNGFGGALQDDGAKLLERLPDILAGHQPEASLLHGDLWGGNAAACDGQPVIFDPAVYYGDRETDLAMMRLFGGFTGAFFDAYVGCWPLADGYQRRAALYQLYHVLNHVNLFGQPYLARATSLIHKLLR